MQALKLHMESCASQEEMNANIAATIDRGYEGIEKYLNQFAGDVSIAGSAPSLGETYKKLTGDVMAINQSLEYLLNKGVIPKWVMLWDASKLVEEFAVPHPQVTYLVASRCHPAVFERLKFCKVIVWHAAGDHNIAELITTEPLICGGSAGVTRAIYVARALGYLRINLFGADSSYSNTETHIIKSLVPEKLFRASIGNNPERWFNTTPEWCAQVEEYRNTVMGMPDVLFRVFGEGMLPTMHRVLKKYTQPLEVNHAGN